MNFEINMGTPAGHEQTMVLLLGIPALDEQDIHFAYSPLLSDCLRQLLKSVSC